MRWKHATPRYFLRRPTLLHGVIQELVHGGLGILPGKFHAPFISVADFFGDRKICKRGSPPVVRTAKNGNRCGNEHHGLCRFVMFFGKASRLPLDYSGV
jgi:hypothetical protein